VALVREHVGDGPGCERGVRAGLRDLVEEAYELGVALRETGDGAAGEEAVAQVADGALNLALGESSRLQRMRRMRGRASE
jgi:hypothetical protein